MIKISFRDLCLNSMKKSVCSNFTKMLIISFKDFNTSDLNFLLLWCSQSKKKKKWKENSTAVKKLNFILQGHSIFCGWSSLEIPSYPLPLPSTSLRNEYWWDVKHSFDHFRRPFCNIYDFKWFRNYKQKTLVI